MPYLSLSRLPVTTLSLTLSPYQASSDATLREVVARELALPLDEVTTALHDVLPTLYDDGAHAQLDEP